MYNQYFRKQYTIVGPKSDHVEKSDLAKRFFIAGWEWERAKTEKEREKGRCLNTLSETWHDLIG
jgi:hypothetical protein